MLDRAAVDLEPHRLRPALPATLAPQMGTNVKCLIALKGRFWRRESSAPEHPQRRPGHRSPGTDRRPAGRPARWSRSRAVTPPNECREWRPAIARARTISPRSRRSIAASGRASSRRASWTGRAIRGRKASYSFPAPGQVTTQGPTLRQGIGRLHFAGEYTSYAFMGYMEGALESGCRRSGAHRGARRRAKTEAA